VERPCGCLYPGMFPGMNHFCISPDALGLDGGPRHTVQLPFPCPVRLLPSSVALKKCGVKKNIYSQSRSPVHGITNHYEPHALSVRVSDYAADVLHVRESVPTRQQRSEGNE